MEERLPQEKKTSRTWRLFERSETLPPFQVQRRDLEILRHVFRHRFLRPVHIHALLGGSAANLNRRLKLLFEHGFLERPKAQRPLRALTEQLVYGLGPRGARALEETYPALRDHKLSEREWRETPKKVRRFSFMDHELGVADFMVPLEIACARISSPGKEVKFLYHGYPSRKDYRFETEKRAVTPDAFFAIKIPRLKKTARQYLEFDRTNVELKEMAERYRAYLDWWKQGHRDWSFNLFRVLTVCEDPDHAEALRRVAAHASRKTGYRDPPRIFWFTDTSRYNLARPEAVLDRIFRYPEGEGAVSLLEGLISLPG